ncbi:GNAT family N-acetyltransferase [Lacicoccus alkaliphilus]|uniref:Protein N-acetyltransferase, RimJ/RimL family n=1 Tax=Lacicoccus alkaliphilus DSM 16010 TaxID=1123231 RepID=A0A1M7HIN3_9BACL|nr:GNAT family protein [Salinicoccus alkaliphilus]SHM28007.1 Protein N-acetyltransferase, RimJ/RimL family [Salinicoccus alkaliphilus DSM 16010]
MTDKEVMLKFYDPSYLDDLKGYVLTEAHAHFSAHPLDVLDSCLHGPSRRMVLIIQEGVAGVFILQSGDVVRNYSDNTDALVMFSYSIDSRKQGRGIAGASFRKLDAFVKAHYERVDEVVLGVNVRNEAAKHVYKKAGFKDTGRSFIGPVGRQIIMSRCIGS